MPSGRLSPGTPKGMVASVLAALLALAVPAAGDKPSVRGTGGLMFGGTSLGLDGLNASLRRSGRPAIPSSYATLGGYGHVLVGRLLLGGEGNALIGRAAGEGDMRASVRGFCGFFDLGYAVHAGRALVVYPLFGVGAGAVTLGLDGRSAQSFDASLAGRGEKLRLQKSGFLLNFALGADTLVPPFGGRLLVGVRLGYVVAPVRSDWELGSREVEGGPDADWTGPYLRISIGWGGR